MKRGTHRHPKLFELCDLLGCARPTALGYLDLLWSFTAEFAPQGDIGKYSDKRIEAACDWHRPAGKLVKSLVESGWIDIHPTFRLVVHDWHDHAEDSVRKRLSRAGLPFLSFTSKVTGQCQIMSPTHSESVSLPLPLPIPVPVPPPKTDARTQSSDTRWNEFAKVYPAHRFEELLTAQLWVGMEQCDRDEAIEGLRLAVTSPEWTRDDGRFVLNSTKFLSTQAFRRFRKARDSPTNGKVKPYIDPLVDFALANPQEGDAKLVELDAEDPGYAKVIRAQMEKRRKEMRSHAKA